MKEVYTITQSFSFNSENKNYTGKLNGVFTILDENVYKTIEDAGQRGLITDTVNSRIECDVNEHLATKSGKAFYKVLTIHSVKQPLTLSSDVKADPIVPHVLEKIFLGQLSTDMYYNDINVLINRVKINNESLKSHGTPKFYTISTPIKLFIDKLTEFSSKAPHLFRNLNQLPQLRHEYENMVAIINKSEDSEISSTNQPKQ